jgi:hypothetical protein
MQPVNFQCGSCHNLMAVSAEFLGQQVRCPHCQQVVVAPPPTDPISPPAPAPIDQAPPPDVPAPPSSGSLDLTVPRPAEDHDSIFAPPPVSDDLFGGGTEAPRIEIPAGQPSWMQETMAQQQPAAAPPPSYLEPTVALAPSSSVSPVTSPAGFIAPHDLPTVAEQPTAPAPEAALSEATELFPSVPRPAYKQSNSSIWMYVALICLVSYSILATIKIADFYMQLNQRVDPLEILPDNEGEDKGFKKTGKRGQVSIQRRPPTAPLTSKLITQLGRPLTIGDVQVTPEKVELKKVRILASGGKPELGLKDSLVLQLRMKNVSSDLIFSPTDRYFDRRVVGKPVEGLPYTFLEFDGKRFFSGIDTRGERWAKKEHVEGQTYGEHLQPGEELTTVVCTDPEVDIAGELAKASGTLLWRVQVRRGIVEYKDREYSTTAVVGVEFTKQDIQKRDIKAEAE